MRRKSVNAILVALALLVGGACGSTATEGPAPQPDGRSPATRAQTSGTASCPATAAAPQPLPGVEARHLTLAYWLERAAELGDPDQPLLTADEIEAHNRALADDSENGLPIDRASLGRPLPSERLAREVRERLGTIRERVESGEYVDADGRRLDARAAAAFAEVPLRPMDELRIALGPIPLRCGPRPEGLYKSPVDLAFDRNNCSMARPQEPVQVLMRWPNGMLLARTRYSLGWIAADAPLSPVVPAELKAAVATGPLLRAARGTPLQASDARMALETDALLPTDANGHVLFADAQGVHRASTQGLPAALRPLTRRAVLEEAFARLDRPYGWGDHEGGVDCSRFVMDVLGSFGLELPRHSGRQAGSGTYSIDLAEVPDLGERTRLLDAAARRGVVLLHLPGHIMLYLGRDDAGTPRVIHSFSEYLETCGGGEGETLRRVDRVTVSDLILGHGTSRRSFLERIDRIVILGRQLGPELIGVATPRAPAAVEIPQGRACEDSTDVRIFHSPEHPNARQPLRVFVTSTRELGPVELALIDPSGGRHTPAVRRLGGPPFTYWVEIPSPASGRWTVALGDGANVAACDRVAVAAAPFRPRPPSPDAVWTPRRRWEADTEALFAGFVEQLFDYPIDQELTWPNLTVLLQDRSRNILFDHFGQSEEDVIRLQPDCADLPYFLRSYFAWKLRLPFGFRTCTRGRGGELPTCSELEHPQVAHERADEVDAFRWFINSQVKHGVHSASGRTHPDDSETALYPVPMTQEALRPGTVFADPYGHLLVVARWVPQGLGDRYGILIGAEAQPDGTVGRRRFWRGTFLFDPDTTHVGAGFKGWRPVIFDRRDRTYRSLPNEQITARNGYVPFSRQQYEGSLDGYYERMEELINPRPLDAWQAQRALIDALQESAVRRVVSVQNGEDWKARNPGRVIDMPEGSGIFLTAGPWEEYATPSRDLRILIAIDTVLGFADVVRRSPARFGLRPEEAEATATSVRTRLTEELARRSFRYRRSDGQEQTLTLADVVARARAFEAAYDPNDCVELRWGAPEGSAEARSCQRRAPAAHRARMEQYRTWFATRRRPFQ
jgi:cell wall-associated NlpC family hydrolase